MRITNVHGLPQPIVKLLERQAYSRGRADISVTELISPPQIVALKRKHRHEMVEDVADRFWAIMGTNIHSILEGAADMEHLPEERLFVEVNGWVVSGQIDLQHRPDGVADVDISDWKFTSTSSIMYPKKEWEQQLNLYAFLVEATSGKVGSASVVALLRDWRRALVGRTKNYPVAPVVKVDIPLWPFATRKAYVEARVALHQEAMRAFDWGGDLPECSADDRWSRRGNDLRCQGDYCGVSAFCAQRKRDDKAG